MYGVIVTAHSNYASGVYSGIKLVAGDMENVKVVDYLENQSYEDLDANLKKAFDELKDYKKKIFITDLVGGTPFSRSAFNFGLNEDVRVLSGLNFALIYTAMTMDDGENMDEDIKQIIKQGKAGITAYIPTNKKQEDKKTYFITSFALITPSVY